MFSLLVLIIEVLFLAFYKSSWNNVPSNSLIVGLIILFSIAYFFDIGIDKKNRAISPILAAGYLFRLTLLFWDRYCRSIFILPSSGTDTENFFAATQSIANGEHESFGGVFTSIMGNLSAQIGTSRLYLQFLVLLSSLITLHTVDRIMKMLEIPIKKRQLVMCICCFLPHFAILSSLYLREAFIAALLTLSLYSFLCWYQKKGERWFLIAHLLVFTASSLHSGTVGIAVGYVVVRVIYDQKRNSIRLTPQSLIVIVVSLFVFLYLFTNYKSVLFGKMSRLESLEDIASGAGRGGSSYARYVGNSSTPLNMIIYTLPRMIYFLFSPMPWQWRGLSDIIAFFMSGLFYGYVVFSSLKFMRDKRKENRVLVLLLLIIALCVTFVFGWGVSNTGTALRHRDKMVSLYVVLLALTNKGSTKPLKRKAKKYLENKYGNE